MRRNLVFPLLNWLEYRFCSEKSFVAEEYKKYITCVLIIFCPILFSLWCQPKKKNMSAYQVFCKEYRVTIVADHPGIGKNLSKLWVLFCFVFTFYSLKQCI